MHTTTSLRMLRKPDLTAKIGIGGTQIDRLEASELLPKRVALTERSVGWPEHEVDAVLAARLAGKSDDDIRSLVRRLVVARARTFSRYEAA